MIFSAQDRKNLRSMLIKSSQDDPRIVGAAITGSSSVGVEDRWSDIDLFFGIKEPALEQTLADWTTLMYATHDAVDHFDVVSEKTVYRVFLLRNTLQVDLAFAPESEFGAKGETFKLLFGNPIHPASIPSLTVHYLVGTGWLYALHARACIKREQWWRAEHYISDIRSTILTLACLRYGQSLYQARGFDRLPKEVTAPLENALVRELNVTETSRAFNVAMDIFFQEIETSNASKTRLTDTLRDITP